MSSCASHSHRCSFHESEHFPRCPFCNPALLCSPASPFTFFHERVLNFLGMDRGLSSGLGIAPIDRLSSFGSFGGRFILQRLTGYPQRSRVCCSPKPLQNSPITHLRHSHVHRRSITIAWPKTALHLELPSPLYLFICAPLRFFGQMNPSLFPPRRAGHVRLHAGRVHPVQPPQLGQ